MDIKKLKAEAEKAIESSQGLKELDQVLRQYLGKKGELTHVLRSLKKLGETEKIKLGQEANKLKNSLQIQIKEKAQEIKKTYKNEVKENLDITIPGKKPLIGHLHPITQVRRNVEEIFRGMGFSVVEGPEVETERYAFDALNIPKDHPARDVWDTFWLKTDKQRLLLRPHTSPVQIRYMEKHQPPFRIIAPGKVFRHEATDASHDAQFYQVEGLMIGKDISVANFRAVINEFLKVFLNREIKTRLRPGYFPFTEPSFELDVQCVACKGKGCPTCKRTGWLELCPGGMVHPNVLKAGGVNPKFWQGFAFGMGMDRAVMTKYKINDIRLFHSNDLRFLNQF